MMPAGERTQLELRSLGTAQLLRGDLPIIFPTRKALTLALYVGLYGCVPRATLALMLWPRATDTRRQANLSQELLRLRQIGVPVITASGKIEISEKINCDVTAFEAAIRQGHDAYALQLYRGPFLNDLGLDADEVDLGWLEMEAARLEILSLSVLSREAIRLERDGDIDGAIKMLNTYLEHDPYAEFVVRDLARLIERRGDLTSAVTQLEQFQHVLERDLGGKPDAETRVQLENLRGRKLVDQTTSLRGSPFVGRTEAWALLEAAWREGKMGAVISGDPGVGKTRLATEFASAKGSFESLEGRPIDLRVPYASIARKIRQAIARPDFRLEAWERLELMRIIPQLALPDDPMPAEHGSRLRLFEAIAEVQWRGYGHYPVLIADDVHWYDETTAEVGQFWLERFAESGRRAFLIVTHRRGELSPRAAKTYGEYVSSGLAVGIDLQPLSSEETTQLYTQLGGRDSHIWSTSFHHTTGGNPFFALETLRDLAESGRLSPTAEGWSPTTEFTIPNHLLKLIVARVDRLGKVGRRVLEILAICGQDVPVTLLASLAELRLSQTLTALERADESGLVWMSSTGYRFQHDLIGRAIEGSIGAPRAAALHARIAETLIASGDAPARIAVHFERAERNDAALEWWLTAANRAEAMGSINDATDHLRRAIALLSASDVRRTNVVSQVERLESYVL